jgi:fatty-acyl-CoA synthase
MIIRGGENIYPREIEEFLYTMPGIADVQVAGVPSRKYGEEVGAFIILKKDVTMEPEEVRDFCRGQIAWHKIPKYIAFVAEFPLTTSGKVQKYNAGTGGQAVSRSHAVTGEAGDASGGHEG